MASSDNVTTMANGHFHYYDHREMMSPHGTSDAIESAWETNNDMNFKLSLVSIVLLFLFLLWRLHYYLKHRNDPPPSPTPQTEQVNDPPKPRTQESIKQLLVLKTVKWATKTKSESQNGEILKENFQPLDSTILKRKTSLILHDGDEESGWGTCPICLCDYDDGDQICWSNNQDCWHHFHSKCGIAWLEKHSECPVCRAEYLIEPTGNQTHDQNTIIQIPTPTRNVLTTSQVNNDETNATQQFTSTEEEGEEESLENSAEENV